jgi:hypothetical protein
MTLIIGSCFETGIGALGRAPKFVPGMAASRKLGRAQGVVAEER